MNLGLSFLDEPELGVPLVACLTSLLLVCGDILLLAETLTKKSMKNRFHGKKNTFDLLVDTADNSSSLLWPLDDL